MFINVQHPGEVGSHPNKPAAYTGDNWIANNPNAFSVWPTVGGPRPRSATVVVRRTDGGVIGDGNAPVAASASASATRHLAPDHFTTGAQAPAGAG